jgi:molybdopterin-containing oxidoreductase family membrane subunit
MLVGMSAGAFLLAGVTLLFRIDRLMPVARPALLVAAATFVGGMLAVWLDLGQPFMAWRLFLATGFTSMMGLMAWFYLAYAILLGILLWQVVLRGRTEGGFVRGVALVGGLLAITFGGAEGALFGVVGARDLWHSGMTPIMFLVEGALAGVALATFFAILMKMIEAPVRRTLGYILLGLLFAVLVLQWSEISIGYYAAIPSYSQGLDLILTGPYWWVFWIVQVGLGLVVPLVLIAVAGRYGWALAVASGLVAFTALSAKLNLLVPAQAVPEFEQLRESYTGVGLYYNYAPTLMEWLVALWVVGVVGLVALLAYRLMERRTRPATVQAAEPVQPVAPTPQPIAPASHA